MKFYRRIPLGPDDALVFKFQIGRSVPWRRWPRFRLSINTEAR